ncbi:MAG: nuclear transport factor 2 family protein [Bacteroidales bacterium]|nr:nuclear transport factor 2 family protein [Bacteroidales bacterium]
MKEDNANIAIVKQLYNAFMKKEINTILGLLSQDVEWGEPENPFNPAGGTRTGHAGFLEWINIGKEAEDILVLEPKQFLTNDNFVAVSGYMKCLAKPTGKVYESDFVHLVKIKDNKIQKFQEFFDTYIAGEAFRVN